MSAFVELWLGHMSIVSICGTFHVGICGTCQYLWRAAAAVSSFQPVGLYGESSGGHAGAGQDCRSKREKLEKNISEKRENGLI